MSRPLLLKGGTVIMHDANDKAKGIKADVLVRGNKIAEISSDITAPDGAEVVDCQDKIIAPGFVDTHRHMWNTALRGRHGDNLLLDYLVQGEIEASRNLVSPHESNRKRCVVGILQSSNYEPDDVFWGQLASCLECMNAGTTTVVDHSHLNYSVEARMLCHLLLSLSPPFSFLKDSTCILTEVAFAV